MHKIYASSNTQKFALAYTKKFTFNHLCKKLHFPLIANSNSCVVIVASIKTPIIREEA
jgi:hypothetical protein